MAVLVVEVMMALMGLIRYLVLSHQLAVVVDDMQIAA
jgi:hypothetical protein